MNDIFKMRKAERIKCEKKGDKYQCTVLGEGKEIIKKFEVEEVEFQ